MTEFDDGERLSLMTEALALTEQQRDSALIVVEMFRQAAEGHESRASSLATALEIAHRALLAEDEARRLEDAPNYMSSTAIQARRDADWLRKGALSTARLALGNQAKEEARETGGWVHSHACAVCGWPVLTRLLERVGGKLQCRDRETCGPVTLSPPDPSRAEGE